jgi:nucleoside-diphosphate-sugar epimerase
MIGDGEVFYHLTYIDDLVEGIIQCGEQDGAIGRTYLLAGPGYTTLNALVRAVAKAVGADLSSRRLPLAPIRWAASVCEDIGRGLGVEPPLHRRRLDFFTKDRAFCIEKAKRELGYRSRTDLATGLSKTAAWYFRHGYLR